MRPRTAEERAALRAERLQAAGITSPLMPEKCSYNSEADCPKAGNFVYPGVCHDCAEAPVSTFPGKEVE